MNVLIEALRAELILVGTACVLFLMGIIKHAGARKAAPWIATAALVVVFFDVLMAGPHAQTLADPTGALRVFTFAYYIKMITAGVGVLLVLLAWPTDLTATGNPSIDYGADTSEFFGLMLLSITGVFLVAGANDMILLFLAIELASIPTYVMVSVSRPINLAQEAGVKYFFLGAMSAAMMLFGFSYLYGTTGMIHLDEIAQALQATAPTATDAPILTTWQLLAAIFIFAGLAFKIAAVPLHFYAGDVYQGAATPVTAFLSFVPKASGIVAIVKLLFVLSGATWQLPVMLVNLLWIVAVLTMSVGNVLALLQFNVKRVMAYSSIAHSGYMLVGVTALVAAQRIDGLEGVLFYLAAYGIMNVAAFGVLQLLPARRDPLRPRQQVQPPTLSAETFEDLAGQGRRHPGLGLAMAVSCFSLIGIPLTVGFFGKFYLIRPAFNAEMYGLVIITIVNAAISAAYYLRIVATMFLRAEPDAEPAPAAPAALPIVLAVAISAGATVLFGTVPAATQILSSQAMHSVYLEGASTLTPRPVDFED